ncbi:hypothetical protein HDE_05357 [Halotydeus destructor]|nr:hypothetical protein HDE_05357 [Halotydeus destructor]
MATKGGSEEQKTASLFALLGRSVVLVVVITVVTLSHSAQGKKCKPKVIAYETKKIIPVAYPVYKEKKCCPSPAPEKYYAPQPEPIIVKIPEKKCCHKKKRRKKSYGYNYGYYDYPYYYDYAYYDYTGGSEYT